MQLLFTLLERDPHPDVRSNIVISLGDLIIRHPNLIEPWTPNIYARLKDENLRVKKNCLMVLTHLILNNHIKVKKYISELALCLEDEDERISSLTKLFFSELAQRSKYGKKKKNQGVGRGALYIIIIVFVIVMSSGIFFLNGICYFPPLYYTTR